jgi:hypothetical protein
MCGAEYGGGEGGERRFLDDNALTGPLPMGLGNLVKLAALCVRPASPCNVGSATHPREAHWVGEPVGVMRRGSRTGTCRRRLAVCGCVRVDVWR